MSRRGGRCATRSSGPGPSSALSAVADHPPVESAIGLLADHQVPQPLRGVDGKALAPEEVAHGDVQALEVAPVVRVGVADHHGVEAEREACATGGWPWSRARRPSRWQSPSAAQQVTAAGTTGRRVAAVRARARSGRTGRRPEQRRGSSLASLTPLTPLALAPLSAPERAAPGAPSVRHSRAQGRTGAGPTGRRCLPRLKKSTGAAPGELVRRLRPVSDRMLRTSKAVSSAELTSTTSGPITSPIVRAR